MKIKVSTNVDEVFRDVDRQVNAIEVAMPRALNKLAEQAQTAALREINRIYKVGPRVMEKYMTVALANKGTPEAAIMAKGKAFPLAEFKPIPLPRGVSVLIKGRRFVIPHTFMVKRFGKHVFARGAYKGSFPTTGEAFGAFRFGRLRLPMNELYTFGPVTAFANEDVMDAAMDRVTEQMELVIHREIDAVRRGF